MPPLPRRFDNAGATHADDATFGDLLRHAWTITFSEYPQADRLPSHHVETPARATSGFLAGRALGAAPGVGKCDEGT